eukprot:8471173-Pyramimonas_sp.AAC.1
MAQAGWAPAIGWAPAVGLLSLFFLALSFLRLARVSLVRRRRSARLASVEGQVPLGGSAAGGTDAAPPAALA